VQDRQPLNDAVVLIDGVEESVSIARRDGLAYGRLVLLPSAERVYPQSVNGGPDIAFDLGRTVGIAVDEVIRDAVEVRERCLGVDDDHGLKRRNAASLCASVARRPAFTSDNPRRTAARSSAVIVSGRAASVSAVDGAPALLSGETARGGVPILEPRLIRAP